MIASGAAQLMARYGVSAATLFRCAKAVSGDITTLDEITGDVRVRVESLLQHREEVQKLLGEEAKPAETPAGQEAKVNAPISRPGKGNKTAGIDRAQSTDQERKGKMTRTQVGQISGRQAVGGGEMHDFRTDGQILFGEYVGAKEVPTKFGPKLIHSLKDQNGNVVSFWGKGMLNARLIGREGDILEIQFLGKKVPVNNGRAWVYRVYKLSEFPSAAEIAAAKANPESRFEDEED